MEAGKMFNDLSHAKIKAEISFTSPEYALPIEDKWLILMIEDGDINIIIGTYINAKFFVCEYDISKDRAYIIDKNKVKYWAYKSNENIQFKAIL